jgi:predicted amidophosphoribosyltransferase
MPEVSPSAARRPAAGPSFWQGLVRDAAEFFFPPACVGCRVPLARESSLCAECRSILDRDDRQRCARCSAPVGPHLDTTSGCIHCQDDRFDFERVLSLGVYRGWLGRACRRAQQPAGAALALRLGALCADRWCDELRAWRADVVIPVPEHWTARLVRPTLTTLAIAEGLGRELRTPVDSQILVKSRRTVPQASLPPSERRTNLRNAFRIARGTNLRGRRICLVDDVLTTGTTAQRATRVLLEAGAAGVLVVVVARGVGR